MVRLLVVGHSFIGRLANAAGEHPDIPDDLSLQDHQVNYLYKRGGRLSDIIRMLPLITKYKPDIVFLQVGGNDISPTVPNGLTIADEILSLAQQIIAQSTCQRVYVGQFFQRFPGKYLTHPQSEAYNAQARIANQHIKDSVHDNITL